jgi:L-aminopeptidase/D-esterase-like protein
VSGTPNDVAGLEIGHWSNLEAAAACTVVLCAGDGAASGLAAFPAARGLDGA